MKKHAWMAVVLALGLAVGCGDDGDPITPTDGGPVTPDGGTPDGGDTDASRPDSGPRGDGNDTFATAEEITALETTGVISPAGDLDYYRFEGEAGTWIWITTEANPDDETDRLDTVITLFDASMNRIAENDDALPRFNTDSELLVRLPSTGTYYVLVQEWSTWAGETPEGGSSFEYTLSIGSPSPTAEFVNVETESGNDAASAQPLSYQTATSAELNLVMGSFASASDVDVFSFSTSATLPFASFALLPAGESGNGSTALPANVRVTNAAGDDVIARITPTATATEIELEPSLPAGDYLLWVQAPATTGANAFYVIKGYKFGDNPPETDDTANDDVTTPDPITFSADAATGSRRGFVLANIGDGDVDHFRVTTTGAEQINVYCGSRTSGSGVVGLTATILDADGNALTPPATATETATAAIALTDVGVPSAGDYVLRLSKTSQDAEVSGNWVRCGVLLAAP